MFSSSLHLNNSNYVIGVHDVLECLYEYIHAGRYIPMLSLT